MSDISYGQLLNEPYLLEKDVYRHKDHDLEDCGYIDDLKEMDDDFDINNYEIITKKGTPFLWAEHLDS